MHGGIFKFFYSLHSIPTIGFEVYFGGKSFVYSAGKSLFPTSFTSPVNNFPSATANDGLKKEKNKRVGLVVVANFFCVVSNKQANNFGLTKREGDGVFL